jgi:hypothetical protein
VEIAVCVEPDNGEPLPKAAVRGLDRCELNPAISAGHDLNIRLLQLAAYRGQICREHITVADPLRRRARRAEQARLPANPFMPAARTPRHDRRRSFPQFRVH